MGGVVVVDVKDDLGVCAKKNCFHAFTHTKKFTSHQQQGLDIG
jgi:hypothetical protein